MGEAVAWDTPSSVLLYKGGRSTDLGEPGGGAVTEWMGKGTGPCPARLQGGGPVTGTQKDHSRSKASSSTHGPELGSRNAGR